eukprot:GABV01003652.1.p2 GENE.GABV01003652.1~~GABV01003652.1.p2  ORF type:complete len:141 (+),score=46.29 GABV01003652.1:34-456(+)
MYGLPYSVYDVTSSGLTHSWAGIFPKWFLTWGYRNIVPGRFQVWKPEWDAPIFPGLNFGMLSFDWTHRILKAQIRDVNNTIQREINIPIHPPDFNTPNPKCTAQRQKLESSPPAPVRLFLLRTYARLATLDAEYFYFSVI